jgi:proteic killer suppression protein
MIRSFKGEFAALILAGRAIPKGFPEAFARVARRKLVQLDAAIDLSFMAVPPGNRLEAFKGDLAGKHSVRINDQWRIAFRWTNTGPEGVEVVDYHRG